MRRGLLQIKDKFCSVSATREVFKYLEAAFFVIAAPGSEPGGDDKEGGFSRTEKSLSPSTPLGGDFLCAAVGRWGTRQTRVASAAKRATPCLPRNGPSFRPAMHVRILPARGQRSPESPREWGPSSECHR
jgi:hypothetical protein